MYIYETKSVGGFAQCNVGNTKQQIHITIITWQFTIIKHTAGLTCNDKFYNVGYIKFNK